MRNLVKKISVDYLGHEYIISIPRLLIDLTGDWTLAAMLNQLLYWSEKKEWIYKSLDDWNLELGAVSRHKMNQLKRFPFIETKIMRANGSPTTHYRIDEDILKQELLKCADGIY